jgi:hypothetical protein
MSDLLFFSEVLFFWCLATATPRLDLRWTAWKSGAGVRGAFGPATRSAAVAAGVLLSAWTFTPASILLAVLAATSVLVLFAGRPRSLYVGLLAELELVSTIGFSALAGAIIWLGELHVGFPLLRIPLPEARLAFLYLASSGFVLAVWLSGNIVRGFLQKSHVLPSAEDSGPNAHESRRLEHGRLIGYLERILIVVLVVKGSYEGLGFLIAAKGLIRAREFEDRNLAEYILVGSLLSVVCALALGIAIQYALAQLW